MQQKLLPKEMELFFWKDFQGYLEVGLKCFPCTERCLFPEDMLSYRVGGTHQCDQQG